MYVIDGNIGSGKSSVLKILEKNFTCFPEPVKEWTMFGKFYENPELYGFPFQYQILLSQIKQLDMINTFGNEAVCFMERCPWTSYNIFLDMLCKKKILDSEEIKVFNKLYSKLSYNIQKLFFLDVEPQLCFNRMVNRDRYEERIISLEYLKDVNNNYHNKLKSAPFEVVRINVGVNKTLEEIVSEIINNL